MVRTFSDIQQLTRQQVGQRREGADVGWHLQHINAVGLAPSEVSDLVDLVLRLGRVMGKTWEPMDCKRVVTRVGVANEILRESGLDHVFDAIKVMNWNTDGHYLWTTKINGKVIIMDPTGSPTEAGGTLYDGIRPYFGRPEEAHGPQRRVYTNLGEMDSEAVDCFLYPMAF